MRWNHFPEVNLDRYFSPALKKAAGDLNKKIQAVHTNRRGWDDAAAKQAVGDLAEIDFDNIVGWPALRSMWASVLQEELRVRRELAEFDEARESECQKAIEAAFDDHAEKEKKVQADLETMGYHPFSLEPDPHRWLPGWIAAHPDVYGAREEKERLQNESQMRAVRRYNAETMQRIVADLEKLRTAAVAA